MPLSRGRRRTRNAPTGEYAIHRRVFASASPPTMIYLQAATGERNGDDDLRTSTADGTTADFDCVVASFS